MNLQAFIVCFILITMKDKNFRYLLVIYIYSFQYCVFKPLAQWLIGNLVFLVFVFYTSLYILNIVSQLCVVKWLKFFHSLCYLFTVVSFAFAGWYFCFMWFNLCVCVYVWVWYCCSFQKTKPLPLFWHVSSVNFCSRFQVRPVMRSLIHVELFSVKEYLM